jgi:hypothetical protein
MTTASLLKSWDLTVGLDRGHFYLQTDDPYLKPDFDLDLLVRRAQRDGIAQRWGMVVVRSPHLVNYAMPLRVELLDDRPEDDSPDWQEVFEVDLKVGKNDLTYESPGMSSFTIPIPPGEYHVEISGIGFSTHDRPGSTTPGDRWRLRLWPCDQTHPGRRIKSWDEALPPPEELPEEWP